MKNGHGHYGYRSQQWQFTFVGGTGIEAMSASGNPQEMPLSQAKPGDRVWITAIRSTDISMLSLGVVTGAELEVISCTAGGSVIVSCQGYCLGFGAMTARQILVTNNPSFSEQHRATNMSTHLRELPVGARACIVGYERAFLGYTGKLLTMGLKPGTILTVIRHALWSKSVEIEVQGTNLSLRQQEADALCVERIEE